MAERTLAHAPYLKFLEDHSSKELAEMELALVDTMATPGWVVLEQLWDHLERTYTDQLVKLRPNSSPEEFAAKAAYVRALREAREANKALAKVAERKRQEAEEIHG